MNKEKKLNNSSLNLFKKNNFYFDEGESLKIRKIKIIIHYLREKGFKI